MANNINFTSAIREQTASLLNEVNTLAYQISPQPSLENSIMQIEMAEARLERLSTFLIKNQDRVDELVKKELPRMFSKIQKKISLTHKVISFFCSNSEDLDPRIQELMLKLERKDPFITQQKIKKYLANLDLLLECGSHAVQKEVIQGIQKSLTERSELLLHSEPHFNLCELNHTALMQNHCPGFLNQALMEGFVGNADIKQLLLESSLTLEETIEEGQKRAVIRYFENMLGSLPSSLSPDFVQNLIATAFLQVGIDLQNGSIQTNSPPLRYLDEEADYSEEEGQPVFDVWNEQLVRYEPSNTINLPRKMSLENVEQVLLLINTTKLKHNLSGLGILIELGGDRKLAMTIHNEKCLTLFNPYGDENTQHCPYLATFGSVSQAAQFVHAQISGVKKDSMLFTLCKKCELEEISGRNRAAQTEESVAAQPEEFMSPKEILESLQKIITSLSLKTDTGFFSALETLSIISKKPCDFLMTNHQGKKILDEVYFHLLSFQDKQVQEKVLKDKALVSWGSEAFESDATPNTQKLKAVQRIQIDLLLFLLQQCYQSPNPSGQDIVQVIATMEKLRPQSGELPAGKKNLAHFLFGTLHSIYTEARKKDKKLVSPDDRCFEGDFGRNAFTGKAKGSVSSEHKLQALKEVIAVLKKTWKV
jgi:hypothetical protein